ncbi:biosynthetic-type acetolactate synthase large subunit [Candidatus Soleaferrea massiliensis]|uniref:biosynthetic-type acetolactate synthase large subunit n=1 Tax=Candidatus Soleaferrea massiliensis TaxID=1470354 RepID=UPI0005912B2B|nr:biosynthetic-type acetolactate synthase large subunit [Candidatus Soleaferrea massiliensis]
MKLTGAQIIIECLLEQKVDTVFGFPGGAVLNIYDALYEYSDRINHILSAHEQGASHAADGYARTTGKTGVVIATSGPGATNLVTGIATAYMDSVPLVAITGNVACSLLGLDSFQEVDITGITMPITKHNFIVKDVTRLADTIREAFYIANEGRKGPVLIDVPKDITAAVCDYNPKKPLAIEQPKPQFTSNQLEEAAAMIAASRKPFVYTGGGVIASEAAEELKEFIRRIDAPAASSLMGLGGFDNTDERFMGMLGMHGTKTSALAIGECDLFIGIGTRFSDRVIGDPNRFAQHAKILHIDIDGAEFDKNIVIDAQLEGDIKTILSMLNRMLAQQQHPHWMDKIHGWKKAYPLMQKAMNGYPTPQQVIETLDRLTGEDTIITTEVGQHQMWAAQFYNFRSPRSLATSGGLGTMGYGLGAAIGAQVANPGRRVVNIAGDGSFYMNANELATVVRYQLPVVELIMNNNVLGMVRQWQKLFYGGRFSHTTMNRPTDLVKLAEAYGLKGFTISAPDEVEPVLRQALALHEPVLINCMIDSDINVLPMVPAGASVEEQILEMD